MPAANFADYATWPSDALTEVPREWWRDLNANLIDRINQLPTDYTAYPGQVIAVRADGSGPTTAGNNAGPIGFGLQPVTGFKPFSPPIITGTVAVTDSAHCGGWLLFQPTGPMNLVLATSANPLTGASDRFLINLLRLFGADEVTITLGGGLVNRHPAGHTRLAVGKLAGLLLVGTDVYFFGGTAP